MSTNIVVNPVGEQLLEWSDAAGGKPLDAWLAEIADAAVEANRERTWPHVVKLKYPIEFGTESITELTFRRGRIGDIKGMKLGETVPTEQLVLVASRLCGKPVAVIEKLEDTDGGEVMAIALDFFAKSLSTGKSRSR